MCATYRWTIYMLKHMFHNLVYSALSSFLAVAPGDGAQRSLSILSWAGRIWDCCGRAEVGPWKPTHEHKQWPSSSVEAQTWGMYLIWRKIFENIESVFCVISIFTKAYRTTHMYIYMHASLMTSDVVGPLNSLNSWLQPWGAAKISNDRLEGTIAK